MPTKIPSEIVEKRIKMLEEEISVYEKYEMENRRLFEMKSQNNQQNEKSLNNNKPVSKSAKIKEERTYDLVEQRSNQDIPVNIPKKRGPKKKQMTPARLAKFKLRRIKANARERSRMHGLNEALEILRDKMPSFNMSQKLSKIETLRLANNYIGVLSDILNENSVPDNKTIAEKLCYGLSQNTMNIIANALEVNPRTMNYIDLMKDYNLLNDSLCAGDLSSTESKIDLSSPCSSISSQSLHSSPSSVGHMSPIQHTDKYKYSIMQQPQNEQSLYQKSTYIANSTVTVPQKDQYSNNRMEVSTNLSDNLGYWNKTFVSTTTASFQQQYQTITSSNCSLNNSQYSDLDYEDTIMSDINLIQNNLIESNENTNIHQTHSGVHSHLNQLNKFNNLNNLILNTEQNLDFGQLNFSNNDYASSSGPIHHLLSFNNYCNDQSSFNNNNSIQTNIGAFNSTSIHKISNNFSNCKNECLPYFT